MVNCVHPLVPLIIKHSPDLAPKTRLSHRCAAVATTQYACACACATCLCDELMALTDKLPPPPWTTSYLHTQHTACVQSTLQGTGGWQTSDSQLARPVTSTICRRGASQWRHICLSHLSTLWHGANCALRHKSTVLARADPERWFRTLRGNN